jgi:segregation and condensation protein A
MIPVSDQPQRSAAEGLAASPPSGDTVAADRLVLHLEGFDGPLDLLLDLARSQKLDLAKISILSLVNQYLRVIEGARRVRLELAADWLVMAAWLTWLKSRLLLPAGTEAAEEAEQAAEVLAARLRDLHAMRLAAAWLLDRPQLGQDVFARGEPESFTEADRSRILMDGGGLVRAYLAALRRGAGTRSYRPAPLTLWSVKDALARLADLVGALPDWTALEAFLPDLLKTPAASPMERRAATASTLLAGLELARGGMLRLRQEAAFGPILVRRAGALPNSPVLEHGAARND